MTFGAAVLVVPSLDGQVTRAYAIGRDLVERFGGTLDVLDVQAPLRWPPGGGARVVAASPPRRHDPGEHDRATPATPRWIVRSGPRVAAVAAEAAARGPTLVVTELGRRRAEVADALALVRRCPASVWLARGTDPPGDGVVVIVTPDPARDAPSAAERAVLAAADRLAAARSTPLTVVHIWRAVGETLLRGRLGVRRVDLQRHVDDTALRHQRALERLLASHRFEGAAPVVRVVKADPATATAHVAATSGAELVVIDARAVEAVLACGRSVLAVRAGA